jgi:hypothetical protein
VLARQAVGVIGLGLYRCEMSRVRRVALLSAGDMKVENYGHQLKSVLLAFRDRTLYWFPVASEAFHVHTRISPRHLQNT